MPAPTLPDPRTALAGAGRRLSLLPSDMPLGHASGPAPHRILLIGSDAVAGHGVRSHGLGLAGCLAHGVSAHTGHGADVDLVVCEQPGVAHLDAALRRHRVAGLDAVVIVLDHGRSARSAGAHGHELRQLLIALIERLPDGAPIVVAAAAPAPAAVGAFAHRGASRTGDLTQSLAETVGSLAAFTALPGPFPDGAAARDVYRDWSRTISDTLVPHLRDPQAWRTPQEHVDEPARQQAVEELGTLEGAWEAEFEQFVTFARAAYGTRSAALSVVDAARTRVLARRGIDVDALPREETICNSVLSMPGGVIVGDAREDPRFEHLPWIRNGDVAFYAGYRVTGRDGQPVGVLCVFDEEPRPVLSQDIALLRDLAHSAQRRIWELGGSHRRSPAIRQPDALKILTG
jgi:hypothetical protein